MGFLYIILACQGDGIYIHTFVPCTYTQDNTHPYKKKRFFFPETILWRRFISSKTGLNPFGTAVPFWEKTVKFEVVGPQNGTAVLKGLRATHNENGGFGNISSKKKNMGTRRSAFTLFSPFSRKAAFLIRSRGSVIFITRVIVLSYRMRYSALSHG